MATFFPTSNRTYIERIMIQMLRLGDIPTHIGFIMDGNRRYARRKHVEQYIGHSHGFEKLAETLSWCRDLGITQATIFAFSIENFKRSHDEVNGLMNLFRKQFAKLMEECPKFDSYEVCVRVYGRLELLPADIQQSIARVVLRTAKHSKFFLNVCLPYTARDEITNAIADLQECAKNGIIEPSDINQTTLSNALYSLNIPDPEMLVRTSGEIRLSDFLLWQTNLSHICFVKDLWPDFSIWTFFGKLLQYQAESSSVRQAREQHKAMLEHVDSKWCQQLYQNYVSAYSAGNNNHCTTNCANNSELNEPISLERFIEQRQQRIKKCFEYICNKRRKALETLLQGDVVNNGTSFTK